MSIIDGKPKPWFYSLRLSNNDSLHFSTWLMENTPEELSAAGFSAQDIESGINWPTYVARRFKAEFTRSFNQIKSVTLLLNKRGYEYLKKSLLGFGLHDKGNNLSNDQTKIMCMIDEKFFVLIKNVETELTKSFPESTIKISDNLIVHVNGKRATWEFNYQ